MNMKKRSNPQFKKIIQTYMNRVEENTTSTEESGVNETITSSDLEFALTILLVELASSDQNFDQQEYHSITIGLQRIFGTERAKVRSYINRATLTLAQYRSTLPYAELLKANLNPLQLKEIVEIIDDLVDSDGQEDPFEIYHRQRLRGILLNQ
jgi:uncharacterized tellurite resistance protein B-like protein